MLLTVTQQRRPTSSVVVRFLRMWTASFGAPPYLFTDNASVFTNSLTTQTCHRLGIQHVIAAPNAHWSNGACERLVQNLLHRIQRHGPTAPWPVIIARSEFNYNNSMHSSLNCTPFEAFLGMRRHGTELTIAELSAALTEVEFKTQKARERTRRCEQD